MKRLYTVEGIPTPIQNDILKQNITYNKIHPFLKNKSVYVVLIEIIKGNSY